MAEKSRQDPSRTAEIESLYRRYSRAGQIRQRLRRALRSTLWLLVIQPIAAAKRLFDIALSLGLLAVLSPLLLLAALLSGMQLQRETRLGQWCKSYNLYRFAAAPGLRGKITDWLHLRNLPVLFNVLKGDMSFVGPRAAAPGELNPREYAVRRRYNVRPGILSLWWIRRRANIDYGSELDTDLEYVDSHGLLQDFGISLRAIPAMLYGQGVPSAPDKVTILGIPLTNLTMEEAIDTILERLDGDRPTQICFVNADCANIAYRNPAYLDVLRRADFCFADGIGLKLAGKLLAQEIRQNVNGTDLFPRLCEALAASDKGLFLLGARPGVAEDVVRWVEQNHPKTAVLGLQHGYFQAEEESSVLERMRSSGADLLLVAFGAPRQDLWIHQHLPETNAKVAMGVGGLFDFYSGRMPRAPQWMREMGMEWLYRLMQEPGRMWKRYLVGNGLFLFRVLWERISSRKSLNHEVERVGGF